MHILTRGLSTALLSLGAASARAVTFDKTTDYVLRVRRVFPETLRRADEHNINVVHLAKKLAELRAELGAEPGPTRAPRPVRTIRVERPVERAFAVLAITPEGLSDVRQSFAQIQAHFGPEPERLRPRVFARIRDLAVQLAAVDHRPDDQIFNQSLRVSLADLIRFAVWLQRVGDVTQRLAVFHEHDLDVFRSKEAFHDRWRQFLRDLDVKKNRVLVNNLHKVRDQVWREAATLRTETRVMARQTIYLAELPPDLAVVKGLIAGDCSSRECFGYPLSEYDRVFAVLDPGGKPIGAASVTRVAEGYYVNTISGPTIKADVTRMILRGLRTLGEPLLLPTHAQIALNFNFEAIREVLIGLIANVEPRPITFLDPGARDVIERFAFRPYDAMEKNRATHLLPDDGVDFSNLEVHVEPESPFADFDHVVVRREDLPRAMLEAIASGRREVARALWTTAGRTLAEAEEIIDAVNNVRGETLIAHRERVRSILRRLELGPIAIDTLLAEEELFARGRLVAPENMWLSRRAGTFAAMATHLTRYPSDLHTPEITAWFERLNVANRDQFLDVLLRIQEENFATPDQPGVNGALFGRVTSLRRFNARAVSLHREGYGWPNLNLVARHLAGLPDCDGLQFEDQASVHLLGLALTSSATAADYAALVHALIAHPRVKTTSVVTAVGRTLHHLTLLGPTSDLLNDLAVALKAGELLPRLIGWYANGGVTSAERFVGALEYFGKPRGEERETLMQAAVFARLPEFFGARPSPAVIGRLRNLAFREDSREDRTLTTEAIEHHVAHLGDLLHFVRAGETLYDRALIWSGLMRLDALLELYRRISPEVRGLMTDSGKLGALWTFIRRHESLLGAPDPETFFARLAEFEVTYPEAGPRGALTAGQINHFVSLGPTVAQFRRLLVLTGEAKEYLKRAEPLIRGRADLAEMVQPLGVERPSVSVVRREFIELTKLILKRHGAGPFETEQDLDELSAHAGLDLVRHELPPIQKSCDADLSEGAGY